VLVGWGSGAENALVHAIENKDITKSLILLDSAPDGIEWLDAQRKNYWTEAEMLNYRAVDLKGRILLAETILGLAIPWYFLPLGSEAPEIVH
jgi:pimeloyl-ACP methyl ester carboxylesterase